MKWILALDLRAAARMYLVGSLATRRGHVVGCSGRDVSVLAGLMPSCAAVRSNVPQRCSDESAQKLCNQRM